MVDLQYLEPRKPLTHIVTEHLKGWITSGKYKPGDQLPAESELARQFGVSKPSIRASLRELVTLGAVELAQGKPATVRAVSSDALISFFKLAVTGEPKSLREAVELRRGLEVQSILLAAERATPSDIDNLEQIIATLDRVRHDAERWVPAHVGFHMALVKASHNKFYSFLVDALRDTIEKSNWMIIAAQKNRSPDTTFERHLRIYEAVRAHDVQAAKDAMDEHFVGVEQAIAAKSGDLQ